ncbi:TIGR02234 family membrane protein [Nonomuraea spiralis]|uniref:TIGR02234 family membrane protein n=1 Tax=Nonomuraea TaxID=83681 RepID=UPI000F798E8D|nr:TIGR02234 family membrane protein [Nonomuraea sp. WAC 01424]RSN15832.1 TIGR02234 family membrane protein [Nonomuraea sp. WAC 01424]
MVSGKGRRELWGWLALTVVGSCLVLLAAGQIWVRVLGAQAADAVAPTGGELGPVLTPLALAGLAGAVAVLATKGVGRRVVGVLVALCGAGAAGGTWAALSSANVTGWLRERNALRAVAGLPWEPVPAWPVVAGLGGLLLLAGGVLAALRGGRWAGMSARYERAGDRAGAMAGARAGGAAAPARKGHEDRELWDALDRGDDPTESPDRP